MICTRVQPRRACSPAQAIPSSPHRGPRRAGIFGDSTQHQRESAVQVSVGVYLPSLSYMAAFYSFRTHCWEMLEAPPWFLWTVCSPRPWPHFTDLLVCLSHSLGSLRADRAPLAVVLRGQPAWCLELSEWLENKWIFLCHRCPCFLHLYHLLTI